MGLLNFFKKKQPVAPASVSAPQSTSTLLFPVPRDSSMLSRSLLDLPLDGSAPKYQYTDVPVERFSPEFDILPSYLLLNPIWVEDKVFLVYFDIDDNDIKFGLLKNEKMIRMVHDWQDRNWQCFAQISFDGHSVDMVFYDHE